MPLSDIRTPTTLVCGVVALGIAGATLLRSRVRTVHLLFAALAVDIGLWYLSQSLAGFFKGALLRRMVALLAVLLPQFALRLFEAMIPNEPGDSPRLLRAASLLAIPMVVLVLLAPEDLAVVRVLVFVYVFALLTAGLIVLGQRGKRSSSRATQRRVRFLVATGAAAGLASVIDFAWFLAPSEILLPPIGAALSVVFLFIIAQALRYERLLDMSEMVARLLVATALAFLIALIFYMFSVVLERFETRYLSALFALMIILLYEPLRERFEASVQRIFFRERFDLGAAVANVRRRLAHILGVEEMGAIVVSALEQSGRVTDAGLYLRDQDGSAFERLAALGARAPSQIELATARALIDRLDHGPIALEEVEREVRDQKARGERTEAGEAMLAAAEVLGALKTGVVAGVCDEGGDLIGLLVVADDRARDAFSPEELGLFDAIAKQIGVVVENSRVYQQMKDRDRLAVLGQMAAGLAHEIRNPLGAIKGAAQLLSEPGPGAAIDPASREFLGIILEEVDRLDRVVGAVLDLARPRQGNVVPTDVNAVVRRTLQVLSTEPGQEDVHVDPLLDPQLPRVAIDAEQLRQVLMNLVRNAAQAMGGRGKVTVSTRVRFGRGTRSGGGSSDEPFVELTVADNGPGISQKVLENLFMPFFTTKEKGTGLGLAISQRIVQNAGGRIEVRSYEGRGSTFAVILPAAMDALGTPTPGPTKVLTA